MIRGCPCGAPRDVLLRTARRGAARSELCPGRGAAPGDVGGGGCSRRRVPAERGRRLSSLKSGSGGGAGAGRSACVLRAPMRADAIDGPLGGVCAAQRGAARRTRAIGGPVRRKPPCERALLPATFARAPPRRAAQSALAATGSQQPTRTARRANSARTLAPHACYSRPTLSPRRRAPRTEPAASGRESSARAPVGRRLLRRRRRRC